MLISKGSRFSFKLPYLFSRLFINLLPYSRIYTLFPYLFIYFLPSLFFFLSFYLSSRIPSELLVIARRQTLLVAANPAHHFHFFGHRHLIFPVGKNA